jgi:hypothetical protein
MKYMNDVHTGTADFNAPIKRSGYDWSPGAFLFAEGWFMNSTQTTIDSGSPTAYVAGSSGVLALSVHPEHIRIRILMPPPL